MNVFHVVMVRKILVVNYDLINLKTSMLSQLVASLPFIKRTCGGDDANAEKGGGEIKLLPLPFER